MKRISAFNLGKAEEMHESWQLSSIFFPIYSSGMKSFPNVCPVGRGIVGYSELEGTHKDH